MYLSESFRLEIKDSNIIPVIASGTGTGKSHYIYNKLAIDLGIEDRNILMICHLNAMTAQQLKEEKEYWYGADTVAQRFNLNKNIRYEPDCVNVIDYHSFNSYIKKCYENQQKVKLEEHGIKCIVVDEAHELLYSSNYRDLQYIWHYLMKTGIQVIFLSATPKILLQENIITYDKKFEIAVTNKSKIKIEDIGLYQMTHFKNNKNRYREIRRLIKKYRLNKSFVLINNKNLISNVVKELNETAIGMWTIFDGDYTDKMNEMRNCIIDKGTYAEGIKYMITTNAYATGINIVDESVDTAIIFFYSIESLVQSMSRLRKGIKRLIVVKDDISWMEDSLVNVKNHFIKFTSLLEKYKAEGNYEMYFSTIYKQISSQLKNKDSVNFILIDEELKPVINKNLMYSIDYMINQIRLVSSIESNQELKDMLEEYFESISYKLSDEESNEIIDYIENTIMKRNGLIFSKENEYGYIARDELKDFVTSRLGEEHLTTPKVARVLKELGYEVNFSKRTSKRIAGNKYNCYKVERIKNQ